MILLRQKSFSKDEEFEDWWREYKRWEKEEERRLKKKIKESKTPIYDEYLHNLTPSQARVVKEEDRDRKRLNLDPYIEKVERERGYKYRSLKRPLDYENEEKTVEAFKKSNSLKNKVGGALAGGSLGFLGGALAGSLKTKSANKSALLGLAGAGLGTAAGILAGKKIGEKKDEKLIREALSERDKESKIKFKKK